jgi:hypothetical protein
MENAPPESSSIVLDPTQIDICGLPWFPLEQFRALPRCPALYFVLAADNMVRYIGRTVSLQKRWERHHRLQDFASIVGTKIAWLFVTDAALLPALEAACIDYFNPPDNRQPGRPKTAQRMEKFTLMLPRPLHEWAMQQPEGFSPLIRALLERERQRRARQHEPPL